MRQPVVGRGAKVVPITLDQVGLNRYFVINFVITLLGPTLHRKSYGAFGFMQELNRDIQLYNNLVTE